MKSPAGKVAWLLPFFLAGCFRLPFHKKHPVPAVVLAPTIQPPQTLEVADIPLPAKDSVIAGNPIYNLREKPEPIRPPRRKKQPAQDDDVANVPEPPAPTPQVSAIGTLSSGDPADYRKQTENSIGDIEKRLNTVGPLSDPEQKTADHIREFLKQARAALASGDVEGAHTLAGKAQVLLAELTK